MEKYKFYGANTPSLKPINEKYKNIIDQRHLYDLLSNIWSLDTCAEKYRKEWSKDNKTVGQCSITSFLVQDIFGGEVYGVPLLEGGYHCFNVVNDIIFDLTSEQFHDSFLIYDLNHPQNRQEHFANIDKYHRYLLLKKGLDEIV